MTKNGFRLDASDWENLALRTAPAALQTLGVARSGQHSAFKALFGHFRAAQRVLRAPFWHFRAAEPVLGANICLQKGPQPVLLQNGRFPIVPEGACNCGSQTAKIWLQKASGRLQKASGQDLAQKRPFHTSSRQF